ncbi:MAG: DUF177 domain-containing protein [Elusimicrobia bacterium]|nr:DUF177 domain-containing protein [Elusimicrobiota bacterium]
MSAEFIFPLTEVKENGRLSVSAATEASAFPDALSEGALEGPVALEGVILAVDGEAAFTGAARGRWKFECTRCLEPLELAWSAPIEAMAPIDGGPMDLTDEVRQSIALAQPMKVLCAPDCKGLCAVCRTNRNKKNCGHPEGSADGGVSGGGSPRSRRPRLTPRPQKG